MKLIPKYILLTLLSIFFYSIICHAVQVNGFCYLENQTNHSGTRILFEADSPSAVTDSVLTDNTGYYQIELEPGLYDVNFSHQNYVEENLFDQLLIESMTLIDVTLSDIIQLIGEISGVLTRGTYQVIGDIVVAYTLIIEPGVVFIFVGSYYFDVFGCLNAVGTEEDSIIFRSRQGAEAWNGLEIWWPSSSSILKYCKITNSDQCGIVFTDASAIIEDCYINGNSGIGSGAGGISMGAWSHPTLQSCIIVDNSAISNTGGVKISGDAAPLFQDCIIAANGPHGGVLCYDDAQPVFENCTISYNWDNGDAGDGINCSENASPTIINCIFKENSSQGIDLTCSGEVTVQYSDFHNNLGGDYSGWAVPPFIGDLLTVNYNNDPCDIYYNIFLDPLFADPNNGNFNLTAASPCIDAGDPTFPFDPDGTIADIGAFYFDQSLPVVDDLTITVVINDVILYWSPAATAQSYNIYRSDVPYFDISGMTPLAQVTDPQYVDSNAFPGGPWYYIVTVEMD